MKNEEHHNEHGLKTEALNFKTRGYLAAENLRLQNPDLFGERCMARDKAYTQRFGYVTYRNKQDYIRYGLSWVYHAHRWENISIKSCRKASNGIELYPDRLTPEELIKAKEYATKYTDEWCKYWADE